MWVYFGASFVSINPINEPPLVHLCRNYKTSADCSGDTIPASWKAASIVRDVPERGLITGEWPCVWHDDAAYTDQACTDDGCRADNRLYENQFAIISEYNLLYLWMIVVAGVIMISEKLEIWEHIKPGDEWMELDA